MKAALSGARHFRGEPAPAARRANSGTSTIAVDFDSNTGRQRSHANREAGMRANLAAEHFDHQVGSAVNAFRSIIEFRGAVDETAQFHDAGDLVQVSAARFAKLRKNIQGACPARLITVFNGKILAHFAHMPNLAVPGRNLTRYVHRAAAEHEGNIVADRCCRFGQFDVQFGKACVDLSWHFFYSYKGCVFYRAMTLGSHSTRLGKATMIANPVS